MMSLILPQFAARRGKIRQFMDIILHIGGHRTGMNSFQGYLHYNAPALAGQGVETWGPRRTRNGLLRGVIPGPDVGPRLANRAKGRIALGLEHVRARGARTLIISDQNMLGSARHNLRMSSLYPSAGERMARFNAAFRAEIQQVIITVRSLECYWASVLAHCIAQGHSWLDTDDLDRLVTQPRSWRDVITDVAAAVPQADVQVLRFDHNVGRFDKMLSRLIPRVDAPITKADIWLNPSPDMAKLRDIMADRGHLIRAGHGAYQPFNTAQNQALRDIYAADLIWLASGADGMARLKEETEPSEAGQTLSGGSSWKGQEDEKGRLAQAR